MEWYHYLLIFLGGALILLIAIILIKAATFKDTTDYYKKVDMNLKHDDVVYKLGEALKIQTVSHEDISLTDFSKFQEYIDKVKTFYPLVFSKCEFTQTKEYAIKLKLKGKSDEKPTVLMAHYDVVPVTEGWDHDPFLGEVVDGYLYGRGTIDTKITMACALSALEKANPVAQKEHLPLSIHFWPQVVRISSISVGKPKLLTLSFKPMNKILRLPGHSLSS